MFLSLSLSLSLSVGVHVHVHVRACVNNIISCFAFTSGVVTKAAKYIYNPQFHRTLPALERVTSFTVSVSVDGVKWLPGLHTKGCSKKERRTSKEREKKGKREKGKGKQSNSTEFIAYLSQFVSYLIDTLLY